MKLTHTEINELGKWFGSRKKRYGDQNIAYLTGNIRLVNDGLDPAVEIGIDCEQKQTWLTKLGITPKTKKVWHQLFYMEDSSIWDVIRDIIKKDLAEDKMKKYMEELDRKKSIVIMEREVERELGKKE